MPSSYVHPLTFSYGINPQKFILSCAVIDLDLSSDTTEDVVKDTAAVTLRFLIVLVILGKIVHACTTGDNFILRLILINLDLLLLPLAVGLVGSLARMTINVALQDAARLLDTGLDVSLGASGLG